MPNHHGEETPGGGLFGANSERRRETKNAGSIKKKNLKGERKERKEKKPATWDGRILDISEGKAEGVDQRQTAERKGFCPVPRKFGSYLEGKQREGLLPSETRCQHRPTSRWVYSS